MSGALLPTIDLDLRRKLQDARYRQQFFAAETSALIAAQLVTLRHKRGLSQEAVADQAGVSLQSVKHAEQADYKHWNLDQLRRIGDVLDARLTVHIVPSEDVLSEYSDPSTTEP
jgi:DNA-binding XRE family transcriptional regulator